MIQVKIVLPVGNINVCTNVCGQYVQQISLVLIRHTDFATHIAATPAELEQIGYLYSGYKTRYEWDLGPAYEVL